MLSLIVAKAENNVIGFQGDLPWYIPADLKHFKELTTGHTVVMGRKTYESIVKRLGHGLPNRRNIVLTRQALTFADAEVVHSLDDLPRSEEVFVIGGAEVYNLALPYADRLYVTEVKATVDGDTYFPAIDMKLWREVSREEHERDERNDYDYAFLVYERLVSD